MVPPNTTDSDPTPSPTGVSRAQIITILVSIVVCLVFGIFVLRSLQTWNANRLHRYRLTTMQQVHDATHPTEEDESDEDEPFFADDGISAGAES